MWGKVHRFGTNTKWALLLARHNEGKLLEEAKTLNGRWLEEIVKREAWLLKGENFE